MASHSPARIDLNTRATLTTSLPSLHWSTKDWRHCTCKASKPYASATLASSLWSTPLGTDPP
eukprot:CAMPEP_0203935722 /NCGR_PEP_ID=MMETSP0359-20131031/73427_1 /ASSEMBLY_ACC=CAM_ASM_000338 /TAXON_ID=268821 /ORGANISM="Scrippsiella Hangoei, Strain SHTV-5" /LENGTH=61 /DNA_ID=CAMNT_0050865603 /DNA_START=317 /DNA_END=502 /DNA_ORIENTATION=-